MFAFNKLNIKIICLEVKLDNVQGSIWLYLGITPEDALKTICAIGDWLSVSHVMQALLSLCYFSGSQRI